jgi:hypothetical protein
MAIRSLRAAHAVFATLLLFWSWTMPNALAGLGISKRGGIDLDGNGKSAIVVRNPLGQSQAGRLGANNQFQFTALADPGINYRIVGIADFDGNGKSDLAFQSLTQGEFGEVSAWLDFDSGKQRLLRNVKRVWDVQAVGDLDGDGLGDLVWRYVVSESPDTGVSYIWFGNGATATSGNNVAQVRKRGGAPLNWTLLGAADLNGDGAADMVYISPDRTVRVLMATPNRTCANLTAGSIPDGFTALKFADFTASGRGDILIRNASSGATRLISLNATGLSLPPYTGAPDDQNASCTASSLVVTTSTTNLPTTDSAWQFYASGDYDGDGRNDVVWLKPDGTLALWSFNANIAQPTVTASAGNAPQGYAALFENGGVTAASATSLVLAGTDTRNYLSADVTPKLSFIGTWSPNDSGALIGPFWNVAKLGAAQREGIALGGWVFNGSFQSTNPDNTPVRTAVLMQQDDGTLADGTAALFGPNTTTNGAGSVIVADFNGDGRDDIVFPAHNESPFLWKSSTAWISNAQGGFDKITLPDQVMNHDARLVRIDGKNKILARSFGGSGNNGNGPGFNVLYTWNGSNFTVDNLGDLGGMSVLAGPFTGNSDNWLIVGDSTFGPGVPYAPTNAMLNFAYKFNGGTVSGNPISLPTPYFNGKPEYASYVSEWDPYSKTHTSRLWTTDLNQDGLPDILAGQEIWTHTDAGLQKSTFQLLINRGGMNFTDETDALASERDMNANIDYNVRFADVDGSGIDTMFHAAGQSYPDSLDAQKQGQYVLVNDGTGRLYAAMHDEFRAMRTAIANFVKTKVASNFYVSPNYTPQFLAYRTPNGKLNFLASVIITKTVSANVYLNSYALVNVPLQLELSTDFRRDLTINTRNGSKRIRTFAGNDTINRALTDPDCSIDGGLGFNTVVYPGKRTDWLITRVGNNVTIKPAAGGGGTDTLTRVQKAVFDDQIVDLTAF